MRNWLLIPILALSAAAASAQTQPSQQATPAPAAVTPNDYADEKNWLCRPGRQDACAVDLTTTIVSADGTLAPETWRAEPDAPIDCFYVYPTISTDSADNSDMNPDPAELNVIAQQFARFGSICKLYAPMYRQVSLRGLRAALANPGLDLLSRGLGYDDVRDAWNAYLKRDNRGRGVVLIGHSQGSWVLTALIRNEVDGKPIQSQLVSALLLGSSAIQVPRGRDAGGTFNELPLCRVESQIGCVVAYSAFRSTAPPAANSLFGISRGENLTGACTNPAALEGGTASLHAYLSAAGRTITGTQAPKEWATGKTVDTPWVSVPGLLSARCTTNENATYLEVTVNGNPDDPRTDTIAGDLGANAQTQGMWGLHLIDVNLAMGNLLDIVSQQSRAYSS
ncbi:MAG: DUF3089 domain-containing protein, partial [Vicinamibacterales bacterium]